MARWWRNPFVSFFGGSSRQDQLAAYVMREHRSGRALDDILKDPYLRNRATTSEIRRLLERPDVVKAVGEGTAKTAAEQNP